MSNRNSRKRLLSFFMVLFILALGMGIGTLITYRVGALGPGDSQLKIQTASKPLVGGAAMALSQAFEEVSTLVEPAVVNINTEEVVKRPRRSGRQDRPEDPKTPQAPERPQDPMEDFFRRFFNNPNAPNMPEQYTRRSLGSGVIVDPKGYIITNNHVVESATRVKVSLQGGQEFTA